ncbi:MAG: GTPase HflX [Defluviitaleaceae bacterium]|nr:GTPase HflX [Defluviitaleaceae bacterium]
MEDTAARREKFILISAGGDAGDDENGYGPLDELALLVEAAGAEVAGRLTQRREAAHPGHYLGKGKLEELRLLMDETGADGVVADDELSSTQLKKMRDLLDTTVLDRTSVILDIFAARAVSSEGKKQVELAMQGYRLSRLTGVGTSLSRQAGGGGIRGGGIGTRGPGESKLETDKRHIRKRIHQLGRELEEIRANRALLREKREKSNVPVISMVGYTNAGKSTLMNAAAGAGAYAEDMLFATLDTTTRSFSLPGGAEALITDTVGFIEKLPHHLVKAFRATLEELEYADVLLHVVDSSNIAYPAQMKVVYELIDSLGLSGKPVVTAFNKADAPGRGKMEQPLQDGRAAACVSVSALTGENIGALLSEVERIILSARKKITALIPYGEGWAVGLLHERCEIISEEHTGDGTLISAYADDEIAGRLEKFKRES